MKNKNSLSLMLFESVAEKLRANFDLKFVSIEYPGYVNVAFVEHKGKGERWRSRNICMHFGTVNEFWSGDVVDMNSWEVITGVVTTVLSTSEDAEEIAEAINMGIIEYWDRQQGVEVAGL